MDADGQVVQLVAAPVIIILAGGVIVALAIPQTRQATEDLLVTAYNNASYNISSMLVFPDSHGRYQRLGGYPGELVNCHQQMRFAKGKNKTGTQRARLEKQRRKKKGTNVHPPRRNIRKGRR